MRMQTGRRIATMTGWAKMGKNIIGLVILVAPCVPAGAAELIDTLKSAVNDGGPLTWSGITLYGKIDVAGQ
jgi:hypothetical protein